MTEPNEGPDLDAANQALQRLEAQLAEANRRLAEAEGAAEQTRLQSRLGKALVPQGSSRERLLRAMSHARLLARQEGFGTVIGRGSRKVARKLGLSKTAAAPEVPIAEDSEQAIDRNENVGDLRAFLHRAAEKSREFDRRLAIANGIAGPNYIARPPSPALPSGEATRLIALYDLSTSRPDNWAKVAKSAAQFPHHYQPHLPDALGFYNAAAPGVLQEQVKLAREFGIHAFAFRCQADPDLDLVAALVKKDDIDLPFCVMLSGEEVTGKTSIERLGPLLGHPNYLKVEGKPIVLVDEILRMNDPCGTADYWREWSSQNSLGQPYLICGESEQPVDPRKKGFDAAIALPGKSTVEDGAFALPDPVSAFSPAFAGSVFSYPALAGQRSRRPLHRPYPIYECVFPGRDDDPLRPSRGTTFAYSSPELYKRWLRSACSATNSDPSRLGNLVFVDSWNSWPRGAHLEPDLRHGFGYLKATSEALEFASKFAGRGEEGQGIVQELIRTPDFNHFLQLCESFFGYPVPDKWREMATRGEANFRAKLDAVDDHIILVHSVGKVGSTSVYHALLRGPLAPISFHTHLIPNGLQVASDVVKQYAFPLDALYFIRLGEWVADFLEKRGKDIRVSFVSGVRDPVARNVASFFDNLSELVPNIRARWEANDVGADELHQIYLHIANESPGEWFQKQLEPIAGVDVYSRPFDIAKGYDIYEVGNSRTIVIRVEDLDRCGHACLTKFFGLEDIPLERENKADDKFYASLLKEFRSKPMPKGYLDTTYGDKFAQHFYTAKEIEAFRTKWSGKQ